MWPSHGFPFLNRRVEISGIFTFPKVTLTPFPCPLRTLEFLQRLFEGDVFLGQRCGFLCRLWWSLLWLRGTLLLQPGKKEKIYGINMEWGRLESSWALGSLERNPPSNPNHPKTPRLYNSIPLGVWHLQESFWDLLLIKELLENIR